MNLWDYEGLSKPITVKTKKGNVFAGWVLSVLDAEDVEANEPEICIETEHGIFGLLESEIESIEVAP